MPPDHSDQIGTVVFRVVDGSAERVAVETGIGAEERIEVVGSGLAPRDLVVVRGAEMLRDGQRVAVEPRLAR